MISSLNASALSFLSGMAQIQQRALIAEEQMTTGLKINSVSDAPGQIANLYETRSELAQAQQIDTNLGQVTAEVNTGESTLSSAVTLIERVQTLASEGDTGTATAATRQNIA